MLRALVRRKTPRSGENEFQVLMEESFGVETVEGSRVASRRQHFTGSRAIPSAEPQPSRQCPHQRPGELWPEGKWKSVKRLQALGGTDLDLNGSHLPASGPWVGR